MADEWLIEVPKPTVTTEAIAPQIKELAFVIPCPNRGGVVAVVIGARDADGNFRGDLKDILWRVEDTPAIPATDTTEEIPADLRASYFIGLTLTAIIPDSPLAQSLGVVGMNIIEAGTQIIKADLAQQEQG